MKPNRSTVAIAVWSLLGVTHAAFAYGPPNWKQQMQILSTGASIYGITTTNGQWHGQQPTSTELKAGISSTSAYLAVAQEAGTIDSVAAAIVADAVNFESANPSATLLYGDMKAYSYQGTVGDVQTWINGTTQAQRVAIVTACQTKGGFYSYIVNVFATWDTLMGQMDRHTPMSGNDCGTWAEVDSALAAAMGIAALLGQAEFAAPTVAVLGISEWMRHDTCGG